MELLLLSLAAGKEQTGPRFRIFTNLYFLFKVIDFVLTFLHSQLNAKCFS